jgi:hypothetical protein
LPFSEDRRICSFFFVLGAAPRRQNRPQDGPRTTLCENRAVGLHSPSVADLYGSAAVPRSVRTIVNAVSSPYGSCGTGSCLIRRDGT